MATQSSFRFLAAIMVAFSLSFITACGDIEEDAPTPTPTADAGYDIGTDTSPDDASTPDTAPDPDEVTYSELCSECESRGEQCPDQSRLLSWQREKALSVDEAADELCVEPPASCTEYQDVEDYVWTCTGMSGVYDDYYVDDHCVLLIERWPAARRILNGDDELSWNYHEPGSMSITLCDPAEEGDVCWRLCTGTPKQ